MFRSRAIDNGGFEGGWANMIIMVEVKIVIKGNVYIVSLVLEFENKTKRELIVS